MRWGAVWICPKRWTIMPEAEGWGWLCGSCQNPQAVVIIVRICYVIKKLISAGSVSVSSSTFVFLLTGLLPAPFCCISFERHKYSVNAIFQNDIFPSRCNKLMLTLVWVYLIHWLVDGRREVILWCLRRLVNVLTTVCLSYKDTLLSVRCPSCWRLSTQCLRTYYWQAVLQSLCQWVQGMVAVSPPLLMLRMINWMLMCFRVNAWCLCGSCNWF